MQFLPYLVFDGNCAEAMRFYERLFEGKLVDVITMGETPDGRALPAEAKARIMHSRLVLEDGALLASDAIPPAKPHEPMKGIWVTMAFASGARARQVFDALADGGNVRLPLGKTFWTEAFGMVVDRYGTPWMIKTLPR